MSKKGEETRRPSFFFTYKVDFGSLLFGTFQYDSADASNTNKRDTSLKQDLYVCSAIYLKWNDLEHFLLAPFPFFLLYYTTRISN